MLTNFHRIPGRLTIERVVERRYDLKLIFLGIPTYKLGGYLTTKCEPQLAKTFLSSARGSGDESKGKLGQRQNF